MRVAGVHCRSKDDGCFVASIVVMDSGAIVDQLEVSCSEPAAQAATLERLRLESAELLARSQAAAIAVWQLDPVPGGASRGLRTTAAAARAEGVVMAAASERGVATTMTQGKAIVAATSASKAKDAVQELTADIDAPTDAMRRAAAAALWLTSSNAGGIVRES
jgi:hypothetical protein